MAPLSLLPSVERPYVTGAATQVIDPDQKLGMIGGDGIRGIRLPAVVGRSGISLGNVASTDLVTLDWYQEGSITPLITGTTTAGTGTYSGQFGGFTRIGNRVFYDLFVAWTAHTGTGNIQVDLNDIPFPSSASSNRYGGVTIRAIHSPTQRVRT